MSYIKQNVSSALVLESLYMITLKHTLLNISDISGEVLQITNENQILIQSFHTKPFLTDLERVPNKLKLCVIDLL